MKVKKIKISEILFAEMLLLIKEHSEVNNHAEEGDLNGNDIQDDFSDISTANTPCSVENIYTHITC